MGFSNFDAAIWTAGVTFGWILLVSVVAAARPGAASDLVLMSGLQVLVCVLAAALFSYRRQGKSFSELFAVRPTSAWLFVIAPLLGVALQGPAETLSAVFERFAPTPNAELQERLHALWPKTPSHAVAMFGVVALIGPFVEELIYRGAIYTALRPTHPVRAALWTAALCFTLSHPDSRVWLPILVLALALGFVRAVGGSIWPSYLAHAFFNGTTMTVVYVARDKLVSVPYWLQAVGWVSSAGLLALAFLACRKSPRAVLARQVDEVAVVEPPPEEL